MDIQAIRAAYLADQLTDSEVRERLPYWSHHDDLVTHLLNAWDLIVGLQSQVQAMQQHANPPRLESAKVVDLIDYAYTNDWITWATAHEYLTADGMLDTVATHHLDTIAAIKHHQLDRDAYLEDPYNADRYCTRCGKRMPAYTLSTRGNCEDCAASAIAEQIIQMQDHKGPYYERWREGMLKAVYRLEDELIKETREREPSLAGDADDAEQHPEPQMPTDLRNWTCRRCGHINTGNNNRCAICGTLSLGTVT